MAPSQSEPEFNSTRAELFEALGHPTRIRILQMLDHGSMGFAELKKAVGFESSGHLSFHLGKLEGLLKAGQDGSYSLTDEGREALRVISVTRDEGKGGIKVSIPRLTSRSIVIVTLVVGMLLVASFAVYQDQQIAALNRSNSSQQVGSIVINGTRYSYLDIPLRSLTLPTTILFNGVTFNLNASSLGGPEIFIMDGGLVNVNLTTQLGSGTPVTFHVVPLGTNAQVKFADGQLESNGVANTMENRSGVVYFHLQPVINPWFSHHVNPRAGVRWNSTTDSVELLVST